MFEGCASLNSASPRLRVTESLLTPSHTDSHSHPSHGPRICEHSKLPKLDSLGRSKFAYDKTIHEHCPRRAHSGQAFGCAWKRRSETIRRSNSARVV